MNTEAFGNCLPFRQKSLSWAQTYLFFAIFWQAGLMNECHVVAQTADVQSYDLQKSQNYNQSGTSTPTIDPDQAYTFSANVLNGATGTLLDNSSVMSPAGSTASVTFGLGSSGLGFFESFTSKIAMDSAFGNGTYNFTINTSTPNSYAAPLAFGTDNYPATIPQLTNTNWTNGNLVIDPTQPFTFTWPSFSGAASLAFLIQNTNVNLYLDPTQTSFVLPANTLQANKTYTGFIHINNSGNSNTTSIPGVSGETFFQNQVAFVIQTGTLAPASYSGYTVEKANLLVQNSNNAPGNASSNNSDFGDGESLSPYFFSASSPTAGSVTGPEGTLTLRYTALGPYAPDYQYISGPVSSQTSLDSAYPNGNYTLADGHVVALAGNTYPSAPQVTFVNGATAVWDAQGHLVLDPAVTNTLTWTSFSGNNFATNGGEVAGLVGENGDNVSIVQRAGVGRGGGASAFNTLTIPANTLTTAHTYEGVLGYALFSSIDSPSTNVYDSAEYATETYFTAVAALLENVSQTINFPSIEPQTFGVGPISLSATASSGLPVIFSVVSGSASISGDTLTITGAGSIVVQADQAGNGTYAAAPSVQQSITVNPAQQTIAFPAIGTQVYPASTLNLNATASSGLPVAFNLISGPAMISGNTLTLTGTGTVVLQASQTGNSDYAPAPSVQQSFTVAQTESFSAWQEFYNITTGPAATPQNDGIPNLLKYLFDIDPTRPMPATDRAALPVIGMATGATCVATGNLNIARAAHSATLLPNGEVLVAGGEGASGSDLNSAELYNPATGVWTTTGTLNNARAWHTATLLPSGEVLVAGGQPLGAGTALASAELYNPATGVWTATGTLNTARLAHSATLLPNGQVLVAGGQAAGPGVSLASAELYNPATGVWNTTGSLNNARSYPTATLLSNGQVLAAGGAGGGGTADVLASAELYNPATGSWTTTGSLNNARAWNTATLLPNGQVLVAGGGGVSGHAQNSVELYNPTNGMWSVTGSLDTARQFQTATSLPHGQVLVAGGEGTSNVLASAEFYNSANGAFTTKNSLDTACYQHTATLLTNGLVLVAGGIGTSGVLTSAELYNPSTNCLTLTYGQYNLQTGITINVQTSPDLISWTTLNPAQYTNQPTGEIDPNGDPYSQIQVPFANPKEFIRLQVTSS